MINKKNGISLLLSLVLLFSSISVLAQSDSIKFNDVMIETTTSAITIKWGDIKSNVFYELSDDYGNSIYKGKKNYFTDESLPADSYKAYYLTGYDSKDNLITERVAISAKTKRIEGDQRSFNYMITTKDYIILQWDPVKNIKENYKIFRDGVLMIETKDTTFKDTSVIHGNKHSYLVGTIILNTQVNETGESVTYDKSISYQTNIDTTRINNDSSFNIMSLADANTPTIVFKTFIRAAEVADPTDIWGLGAACGADTRYFLGNNRGFSYSSNSYKTKQQINLNFSSNSYSYSEGADTTTSYCKNSSGTSYNFKYAQADMNDSFVQNVTGNGSTMSMNIIVDENNPLVSGSPAINADIDLSVYKGNGVSTGSTYYSLDHDGFPDYEIYRKDGALSNNTIFTWDAAAHNDGILSLGWPMEHSASGTAN